MHNGTSTHDGTTALSPLATLFFRDSRLSFTVASAPFLQRLLTILRPALGTTTSNSLHSLTIPKSPVLPPPTLVPKPPLPSSQSCAQLFSQFPVLCPGQIRRCARITHKSRGLPFPPPHPYTHSLQSSKAPLSLPQLIGGLFICGCPSLVVKETTISLGAWLVS